MPQEPWKVNREALRTFQEAAEKVGYERREMEFQIATLQEAFYNKHLTPLERLRTETLGKLVWDDEHNADGTPRFKGTKTNG